jgi:hypothetical protein
MITLGEWLRSPNGGTGTARLVISIKTSQTTRTEDMIEQDIASRRTSALKKGGTRVTPEQWRTLWSNPIGIPSSKTAERMRRAGFQQVGPTSNDPSTERLEGGAKGTSDDDHKQDGDSGD